MEKPKKENYGWSDDDSLSATMDGQEAGWQIEGGEEAYYEAYAKWVKFNDMEG